jgi:hypothetical protein
MKITQINLLKDEDDPCSLSTTTKEAVVVEKDTLLKWEKTLDNLLLNFEKFLSEDEVSAIFSMKGDFKRLL